MVVYCLGNPRGKRAAFIAEGKKDWCMSVDNDEVLTTIEKDRSVYFAVGGVPFGDMSVAEYVAYQKSLIKAQPVRERETAYYARLFGFGLSVNTPLSRLSIPKYRMAQFLAKYDLSVREVYLNFDGWAYSRRAARALDGYLKKLKRYFNIFIAVSDYRFIREGAAIRQYAADGTYSEVFPAIFRACRSKKRTFANLAKEGGVSLGDFTLKRVVVSRK